MPSFGSFEAWTRRVRQLLVWLDLPDPHDTRQELAKTSDSEAQNLKSLIQGLGDADPEGYGLTVAEMLDKVRAERGASIPVRFEILRAAILEMCPPRKGDLPDIKSLAQKIRHVKERIVGGKCIVGKRTEKGMRWRVHRATSCTSCSNVTSFPAKEAKTAKDLYPEKNWERDKSVDEKNREWETKASKASIAPCPDGTCSRVECVSDGWVEVACSKCGTVFESYPATEGGAV